jgi:hypothetical protein
MTTTVQQPDPRAEFIAGLRKLASFLKAHPEVPVPRFDPDILCGVDGADDADGARIVATAAATFGAPISINTEGAGPGKVHFYTTIHFGSPYAGVSYRVYKIASDRPQPAVVVDGEVIDAPLALESAAVSA